MATLARARLETLLRHRRLDHTLAAPFEPDHARSVSPTNRPDLDAQLKGGLPRGQISEIVGPRSSGRTSLMLSGLSAATHRGELVAFVDTLDSFDPESAVAAHLDLSKLLWIRGQAMSSARLSLAQEWGGFHTALDRALKALNLVLQTGQFGLVVLDLADVPARIVKRVPFITWMRLQRVIEGTETVCLVMGSEAAARSAEGLTIALPEGQPPPGSGRRRELQPRVIRARWM